MTAYGSYWAFTLLVGFTLQRRVRTFYRAAAAAGAEDSERRPQRESTVIRSTSRFHVFFQLYSLNIHLIIIFCTQKSIFRYIMSFNCFPSSYIL